MTETKRARLHRAAVLAFIAVVTVLLLALAMEHTARGAAGLPAILVYAFAAGFGLEFVGSAWSGTWRRPDRRSQLQS